MIRYRFPGLNVFFITVVVVLSATQAHAQARVGTLRLVVRDATDLAIPGATVTLTLTSSTGAPRTGLANERGEVMFEALPAGDYSARV